MYIEKLRKHTVRFSSARKLIFIHHSLEYAFTLTQYNLPHPVKIAAGATLLSLQ